MEMTAVKRIAKPPAGEAPRRRGRPRAYDAPAARDGHSGATLDRIEAAAGLSRPSVYAAFGDKRGWYLAALAKYVDRSVALLEGVVADDDRPLADTLRTILDHAIAIYRTAEGGRGCLLVGTATAEAAADPDVRALLAEGLRRLDAPLERRFARAIAAGDVDATIDARQRARLFSAVLHSLTVRARAGESRKALRDLAAAAVAMQAGPRRPASAGRAKA